MLKELPPYQKANLPHSCGPDAASYVLRFWNQKGDPDRIAQVLMDPDRPERATNSIDLLRYMRRRGLRARLMNGTWNLITSAIDYDYVPIAMVNLTRFPEGFFRSAEGALQDRHHFYPIVGYSKTPHRSVLVRHENEIRVIRWSLFQRMWIPTDRYFLLNWSEGHRPSPDPAPRTEKLFNKATEFEQKQKYTNALKIYRRITNENPFFPDAFAGMGNVHMKQKNFDRADDYFRKALAREPSMYRIQNNLAWVLVKQNRRLKEAVRRARFAIQSTVDRLRLMDGITSSDRVRVNRNKRTYPRDVLTELLPQAYHTRALAHMKRDQQLKALSDLQHALEYTKENTRFGTKLMGRKGQVLTSLGRHTEALFSLKKALDRIDDEKGNLRARVLLWTSGVHLKKANRGEALSTLRDALSAARDDQLKSRIRNRLNEVKNSDSSRRETPKPERKKE